MGALISTSLVNPFDQTVDPKEKFIFMVVIDRQKLNFLKIHVIISVQIVHRHVLIKFQELFFTNSTKIFRII